jgi:hypothetical protein
MPKRTLSPKRPGRGRKSKQPQSTLPPSPAGPVTNSLETQESNSSIIESPIDPISAYPAQVSTEYLNLYLKDLHKTALETISSYVGYYQVEESIPPYTLAKVDAILISSNMEDAKERARKATQSGFMYCLYMWANGKAKGPRTKEFIEHEAKKEDALAARLEAKGYRESAAKHRLQALSLWDELATMRT